MDPNIEFLIVAFEIFESLYTIDDSILESEIIQLFIRNGCRAANPGEFTLRAFLNGKMDVQERTTCFHFINRLARVGSGGWTRGQSL